MAGTLTPTPYQTVLDGDGVAVSGAKITTTDTGTGVAAATYTNAALTSANTNPIVADSAGRYVAYLPAGANFTFAITTSAGAAIETQTNIQAVPGSSVNLDIEGTVGEAVTAGQVVYLSSAAESPALTAGKWYLTDSDAAVTSTSPQSIGVAVSAIAINTAGTIRLAGEVNSAGTVVVGTTYYIGATPGAIVSSAPAFSRQVGVGLTSSSLLLAATTAVASLLPNPITQDLLFTDNTYDIGKSGASRPRDLFTSRNAVVGADLTVTEDIVVSGAGPHAFGAATNDYTRLHIAGNFTSGGASSNLIGISSGGQLTGHSGDAAGIAGMRLDCTTVTAGNAVLVSQLSVNEPQITVGSGTVDNSASVYIQAAATEATNDYALWVDSGTTRLDGNVTIGATAVGSKLEVAADAANRNENSAQLQLIGSTDENKQLRIGYDTTANIAWIQSVRVGTGQDTLALNPEGGNIGLSTTAPVSLLDVRGPTGTGAASAGLMTLATNELTIVDNDQLGRIDFRSPIATAGTDAIVTAASIWSEANATFSASVNSADIVLATSESGAPVEHLRLDSRGTMRYGYEGTGKGTFQNEAWGTVLGNNAYYNGSAWVAVATGVSSNITQDSAGNFLFRRAPSVSAGAGTTDVTNLTIASTGDIYSAAYADYYSSSTIVGWSSLTSGRRRIMYKTIGKLVFVWFHLEGTSNATTVSFTLPYTSTAVGFGNQFHNPLSFTYNNSGAVATQGVAALPVNSAVCTCNLSPTSGGGWTASNTKIVAGQFTYEMA